DTEPQLKDLDAVTKRVQTVEKQAKTGNDKEDKRSYEILSVVKSHLESDKSARTAPIEKEDFEFISDLALLTVKPILYVCNVDEASVTTGNAYVDRVREAIKEE